MFAGLTIGAVIVADVSTSLMVKVLPSVASFPVSFFFFFPIFTFSCVMKRRSRLKVSLRAFQSNVNNFGWRWRRDKIKLLLEFGEAEERGTRGRCRETDENKEDEEKKSEIC